jgi:hypothetical protein
MWNFGTMHHQGPKNSDTQRKPSPTSSAPTTPWIPNSALPPVRQDSINSIVRKTLLATPEFPRLYADMVLSTRPNSAEAKILRHKYQKILHRINLTENRKSCTHIKISGIRCGSPSLRGEQFWGLAQVCRMNNHEVGCPTLRDFRSVGIGAPDIRRFS